MFYPDYYTVPGFANGNLKSEIDKLIEVHKNFIFGSSSRDYLSRHSTPYSPTFTSGLASTTLIYQLMGTPSGKDVIVAINYAGDPLNVEIGINMANVTNGDTFGDQIGNATLASTTVSSGRVTIQIPARSYSVWVQNTIPLPVELTSFTATLQPGTATVRLNWTTSTEVNNYGFSVERKSTFTSQNESGDSFYNWETIGFVEGHGNSNSPKEYSFVDTSPIGFHSETPLSASGNVSYRLKQIDTDGKFEYFPNAFGIEVSISNSGKYKLLQNSPNPFNPTTNISFVISKKGHVKLNVFNLQGKLISTLVDEVLEAGTHNYQWISNDANKQLASGVYFYSISVNGFNETKKMILLR